MDRDLELNYIECLVEYILCTASPTPEVNCMHCILNELSSELNLDCSEVAYNVALKIQEELLI